MRKFIPYLLALAAYAQPTRIDLTNQGKLASGSILPPECVVGQIFYYTANALGSNLMACSSTNTWTSMQGAGGAVNADWNAVSGLPEILNKPFIPTLTGSTLLKGNSGNGVAAAYTDVVNLFTGGVGCTGTNLLAANGTCQLGSNFNPYSATTSNSTMKATFAPTGLLMQFVEPTTPNVGCLPSQGNVQCGEAEDVYAGGLFNPAQYGNVVGQYFRTEVFNGFNSHDNSNKDSISGQIFNSFFNASGQKIGLGAGPTCWGTGDCLGISTTTTYANRTTAWGDEATKALWILMQEAQSGMSQTAGTVTKSSCAITALAANVVASGFPTDIKTVAVTGSTAACHVGDWLDIDNGLYGGGGQYGGGVTCGTDSAGPTTDYCHESIQLTAVSSSTISALFHLPHCGTSAGPCPTPAPVAPSPVIAVTGGSQYGDWGQNAVIVDYSAAPVTAGTAYVSAQTTVTATVTGIGTSWASIPVTGAMLQYCFAFTGDDYPTPSSGTQKAWFPIAAINSDTSITINVQYTGAVIGSGNAGAYTIRPCGETSQLTMSYGSTSESVNGLVMGSTPYAWTTGHTIVQTVSPDVAAPAGIQMVWTGWGPHAAVPSYIYEANLGYIQAHAAMVVQGGALSSTLASFFEGIELGETSQQAQINESALSMSGLGLSFVTFAAAIPGGNYTPPGTTGDPKAIFWLGDGAHDQVWIYPGAPGTGLVINDPGGPKLTLANDIYTYATIDASQTGANKTFVLPATSGTFFAPPGGSGLERTIPSDATQTVNIGTVAPSSYEEFGVDIWICSGISSNQCARYLVTSTTNVGGSGWFIIAPNSTTYDSAAFQLEGQENSGLNLRLRGLPGAYGQLLAFTLIAEGIRSIAFTPSTTTAVTTAPTGYWNSSFLTQTHNKLLLNYTSTASATIDPTGLTGARTWTGPDVSGTFLLYQTNTTGASAFVPAGANCPAITCTTPYTWMQVTTADGSTGYMPVFK